MTMGEMAQLVRDQYAPDFQKLTIVRMSGWKRDMVWDDTEMDWVPTEPAHPARLELRRLRRDGDHRRAEEHFNGVGYTLPFEIVGAPWINGDELADKLNAAKIPGVYFRAARYKPFYGNSRKSRARACRCTSTRKRPERSSRSISNSRSAGRGEDLRGIEEIVTRRSTKSAAAMSHGVSDRRKDLAPLFAKWRADCERFRETRKKWLMY
jgi:uncharacterized protein YbbC (DUF1343 family)